jgi:hypothetical protein
MDIRTTRQSAQSIASRLFQFALSGSNQNSAQQTQGDSYNDLRQQLFPSSQTNIPSRQRPRVVPNSSLPMPVNARRPNEYARQRSNASMHPSFRSKAVCQLGCSYCDRKICSRGMKAILLADTSVSLVNKVELYSTDGVNKGCVQLVDEDYMTTNCRCRIRDVACLGCGNVVGYHVTQPCEACLSSCNNGHFWMFLSDTVSATERMDSSGIFS